MNTMNAGDWEWAHSMAVERNKILAAKVDATNARLTTANARIARLRAESRGWRRRKLIEQIPVPKDPVDKENLGVLASLACKELEAAIAAVDAARDLEDDNDE